MNERLLNDYEQKTHASFRDSLTGLFNHGIFQTLIEEEIKRSQRYGDPFSLALIDIDSFSVYNKRNSPASGDQALRKVAGIIRDNLRNPDMASRFSEDIFALVLPKSPIQEAYIAIERIRTSVANNLDDITVSAGLASYPNQASNKEELIQQAREALLKAKLQGKNRVSFLKERQEEEDGVDHQYKVLVVDDVPRNVKLLEAILRPYNYEILKAYNGEDALTAIKKIDIDLVLLDVMMPSMDGFEVCRRLKKNEQTRLLPVIMLTALDDTESKLKGINAGADDFISKPPNKIELIARINSLLRTNELNKKLTNVESVIITLANAVEAKDSYTQGHIERVAGLCVELGKRIGLSKNEIDALWLSGILHDVGKIGIPKDILNKPGLLDPEEFEVIKTHPEASYNICLPLKKTLGPAALKAIRHHHEKLDGSGYPDGLKGDEISILAKILAVADIFDALDTDRPYRKAMERKKTLSILMEDTENGKLDEQVVKHLINILKNEN